jgi:hypothetical protein
MSDLIDALPVPLGLPDPLGVHSDGESVIASNGFIYSQYAKRLSNGSRLFARTNPAFMVIDAAIWQDRLYVLGWPVKRRRAASDGVAVWRGSISQPLEQLKVLHRIRSGTQSVAIFDDSLPVLGGALTIEGNGTVDVITAAEAGVFQYDSKGNLIRALGRNLQELVLTRMHDVNFKYNTNVLARYREVLNKQPTIDCLVSTDDGPAIVVRVAREKNIDWELWYPNGTPRVTRFKLGISRKGPLGHISCDARGQDLACVYQGAFSDKEGEEQDPARLVSYLARFRLPRVH